MESGNPGGSDMVALFIDFENIRYSALNTLELDIDPQFLMSKARKYGRVNVANAYADFSRQPEFYKRSLEAAGIARVDVPIKVSNNREQSVVDLYMVMDIFDTVLDRPNIGTFVLMTGDRDFVRICAKLKNQFEKRVVVCGVPGSVSHDLVSSASVYDAIELPVTDTNRRRMRERQVIRYLSEVEPLSKLPPSYTWLRVKLLEPASRLNMTLEEADILLSDFVKRNVLARDIIFVNGRDYRTTYLNRNHPTVIEFLGQPRSEPSRYTAQSFHYRSTTSYLDGDGSHTSDSLLNNDPDAGFDGKPVDAEANTSVTETAALEILSCSPVHIIENDGSERQPAADESETTSRPPQQ